MLAWAYQDLRPCCDYDRQCINIQLNQQWGTTHYMGSMPIKFQGLQCFSVSGIAEMWKTRKTSNFAILCLSIGGATSLMGVWGLVWDSSLGPRNHPNFVGSSDMDLELFPINCVRGGLQWGVGGGGVAPQNQNLLCFKTQVDLHAHTHTHFTASE